MSDTSPDLKPASPVRKTAARAARAGGSVIWLVPIIALIVTLGLAWNSFAGRGVLISVQFADATGITPGETAVKFREITVGKVESVRFTPDLSRVVVNIRVDRDIASYIDTDAEFWIVRPQVTAQGISRLDTVLTGAFIEGYWDDEIGEEKRNFVGLDRPPLTRVGQKGTWIVLSSDSAKGFTEGAPVTFRGVQVGTMQNLHLAEDDETVLADVFINSPHDKRLTTATVFWDTSGFSVSLGPQGVALNVSSVSSLLQGGIEFSTLTSGGRPVEPGHVFVLHPDETTARASIFDEGEEMIRLSVLLEGTIKGVEKGADVRFQGLTVGRVTDLSVEIDNDADGGAGKIYQKVALTLTPSRLGLPVDSTLEQSLEFLQKRVENGLRARLTGAGFFGTSLVFDLVDLPDAEPATLDMTGQPFPLMPTAPSEVSDFRDSAQGFLARVGNLPIEEVMKSATDMMNSITTLTSSEDTRAVPGAVREAVEQINAAADELRQVTAALNESGAIGQVRGLVDEATSAAAAVREAAVPVPGMVGKISATTDHVRTFDFEGVGEQTKGILGDVRAMLGTDDAAQLPKNLSDTLKAASGLLNDLRDGNAAGSLNDALRSAKTAADQIAASVQSFPEVTNDARRVLARADALFAAYGPRSDFNNQAINMLRSLGRAADAFGSVARLIERNPRAFILGR